MAETPPTARLIDLTRLLSRVGRGPLTGIDRVELAYLDRLLVSASPVFALLRASPVDVLLDRGGMRAFRNLIAGTDEWGRPDLLSFLVRKQTLWQRRARSHVRRLALDQCTARGLSAMLRRHLPPGTAYLNIGHTNLKLRIFTALRSLPDTRISVFIHDTIPVDHPEFTAPGLPRRFADMLDLVAREADLVIFNSQQSHDRAQRYFLNAGRNPPAIVAHLAVDPPPPDPAGLPEGLLPKGTYFVTIGTIEPRKNHALLLDIWERFEQSLPQSRIPTLLIVGARGWNNRDVFDRLDSASFMGRSVHEVSGLDDAAVAALLSGARALLFPSHAEGFGLPIIEALALGVPVLCGDLPIYREFAADYPIYASCADGYLWQRLIEDLAFGDPVCQPKPRVTIPTWKDHFEIVLNRT